MDKLSTGEFDKNGIEIKVGQKVKSKYGFREEGKVKFGKFTEENCQDGNTTNLGFYIEFPYEMYGIYDVNSEIYFEVINE